MPGIGFRPLGYYGGGMVPKKYADGNLVEGGSTMYGAGTDPQPRLRNFQEFLQDEIGATEYDREFARDLYNVPPTPVDEQVEVVNNPRTYSEIIFQELNPGGATLDSGIAQHYFDEVGEYPEGYVETGPSGGVYPNEIEQQFIDMDKRPEQLTVDQMFSFLAQPEVQEALTNSRSRTIRERFAFYMNSLTNEGPPVQPAGLPGDEVQLPAMPATGAELLTEPVGSTMDLTPLFDRGMDKLAGPFGDQY